MLHAGAGFRIGSTHQICQDYAAAGADKEYGESFAAISDGCSSSPKSDVGARFLVEAALGAHRRSYIRNYISRALEAAEALHITPRCIEATLGVVSADAGGCSALLYGDGFIFAVREDGSMLLDEVSFPADFPAYPAYHHLGWTMDELRRTVAAMGHDRWRRVSRSYVFESDGAISCSSISDNEDVESCLEPSMIRSYEWSDGWRAVGVISDGGASFIRTLKTGTSKVVEAVPFIEIAARLLAFPDFDPDFVMRRLKRFGEWCAKQGISHTDDLSMAVVGWTADEVVADLSLVAAVQPEQLEATA